MAAEKPWESEINQGIVRRRVFECVKPGLSPVSPSDLKLAATADVQPPSLNRFYGHTEV